MGTGRRIADRISLLVALVAVTLLALALPGTASAGIAQGIGAPAATGPTIAVSSNNGVLGSDGWTAGTTVTLTINGGLIGTQPVVPGGGPGNSDFVFSGFSPIQPGDVVVVRDDVAAPNTTTRTHTARSITVGPPDTALDTVTGYGPVGDQIRVQVWSAGFTAVLGTRLVTADAGGQWTADFSVPGPSPDEQDIVELDGRGVAAATSPDVEGNRTFAVFSTPPPSHPTFAVIANGVFGSGWPIGAPVTVSVAGTPGFSTTVSADAGGQIRVAFAPFQVQVGEVVTVTDGVTVKTTTVTALTVTDVDVTADTVSGTAAPGSTVGVQLFAPDGGRHRSVVADGLGAWTADFSVSVGGQPQDQPFDIVTRQSFGVEATWGLAQQHDPDGDGTWAHWSAGAANFTVGEGAVWGNGWTPGSQVEVTAGPSTTTTVDATGNFMAQVDTTVFQIGPGDVVTVDDGVTVKSTTVTSLTTTGADADADTVSGTAAPGSTVHVVTGVLAGQWQDWRIRTVTADTGGVWTADFSVSVGGRPEDQAKDLVPGSYGFAAQTDGDGDETLRNWGIPLPDTSIGGTVYLNAVDPGNVLGGVLVEACNDDDLCRTTLSNPDGSYRVGGLQAGSYDLKAVTSGNNLPVYLGPVAVAAEQQVSGVDIIVSDPPTPPPAGAVEPSSSAGGTIVVHWWDELTLTASGCPNGTATFTLTVLDDGYVATGPMTETPAGSGTYKATLQALAPHHGVAEIVYEIACPGGGTEVTPFPIYIDPSGVVIDTTGAPVAGATVTLLEAQSPGGPFTPVPDGGIQMSPANRTNPDTTDADGRFGWDVTAGYYKVRAEKAGCFAPGNAAQPFSETGVLTIPPPVTDLELTLECPQQGRFFGMTPKRILDSRPPPEQVGPYATPWGAGQTREVTVAGGTTGVPTDAIAVVLNVTVTGTTAPSFLTLWPNGAAQPTASNLNWSAGQTIPNAVTVKVGDLAKIKVFNNSGAANVIIDVVGWYDESGSGAGYTALEPTRVLDSRPPPEQVGPFATPWGPGTDREVTVAGPGTPVPADADAVVLNATVTATTAESFLTVYPNGATKPTASSLNWKAGTTIPNAVTVKVGTDGKVRVFNNSGSAHVILDVVGYFKTGTGDAFHPVTPTRFQDSRPPPEQVGAHSTPWATGTTRTVAVTTGAAVPSGATAVLANVTVTNTTAESFLTVWNTGAPTRPTASNLNWTAGATIANAVTAKVGTADTISVYDNTGSVHVIADAAGWYG
jgi:hypothetical protein